MKLVVIASAGGVGRVSVANSFAILVKPEHVPDSGALAGVSVANSFAILVKQNVLTTLAEMVIRFSC